jgi:hypothetical protein
VAAARLAQQLAQFLLMSWIAIGVHQGHGGGLDPGIQQAPDGFPQVRHVQRHQDGAVRGQPLGDFHDLPVEGLGADDLQSEEVRPLLSADARHVRESPSDEEGRGGALALQQGIGPSRGGEAHGDRRELGVQRRARHQPGRQHGCLLRGAQLERDAGELARRQRAVETQESLFRVPVDRRRLQVAIAK